ncbi:hypothetical protein NYR30_01325 [Gallibacterium salpingitidis]|uniref:hypothetical protein n=1 Tax=Gallibacterium salpingitidis TaxID=505341 RepID=UPI00266F8F63|nr:hypothetical protein [Gallibacterium salpingitidis]WKS99975.1 hypothetical protein NYR30_01325 [Gallibacterium salpingitidis]
MLSLSNDATVNAADRMITGGTKPGEATWETRESVGGGNAIEVSGGKVTIIGNLRGGRGQTRIQRHELSNEGGKALVISGGEVTLTGNLIGGLSGECTADECWYMGYAGKGGTALVMTRGSLNIKGDITKGAAGQWGQLVMQCH